jgi:DnaK suppressor protein
MSYLNDTQLQVIGRLLSERETDLRAQVQSARAALAERPSADGRQVEDQGEQGEQRVRAGIEHAELQRDLQELREIVAARERMADGRYGECPDCGQPIALERLKAQPTATRCVPCQAAFEKTRRGVPPYAA